MRKIGILGGTFDPPHNGHLLIAEQVRIELELEEIWFLPANIPPHKQKTNTTNQERLAMLEKAVQGNPFFKICTAELERSGISYTIDTMKELKGLHPDCAFYFIIGADMVEYLPKWYKIDELTGLVQFVGVRRAGYETQTDYPVLIADIPMFDVSSSLIRKRVKEGQSIRYLLPDSIIRHIGEHHLYGD